MNDATETLSIKALTFIVEREDLLEIFVDACGVSLNELYEEADRPETWAAMLDFILSMDEIILDFCDATQYTLQDLWRARTDLPGAPANNFTST
jgi:hypothetical protein